MECLAILKNQGGAWLIETCHGGTSPHCRIGFPSTGAFGSLNIIVLPLQGKYYTSPKDLFSKANFFPCMDS
jgi:hypothetical protein